MESIRLSWPQESIRSADRETELARNGAQQLFGSDRMRHALDAPGLTWPRLFGEAIAELGQTAPSNDNDVIRAGFSSPVIQQGALGMVNTAFEKGYDAVIPSWRKWVREVEIFNFLPAAALTMRNQWRLSGDGRGATSHGYFSLSGESWGLRRYTGVMRLAESDMIFARQVDVGLRAFEQAGAAAARLPSDLIYSLLLQNPTLVSDGLPLFCSDHHNTGSDNSIGLGMAAIASQVATDQNGAPIHLNLTPKYLIAAPDVYPGCRYAARMMTLDAFRADPGDLIVRSESRLGPVGVLDPQDEKTIVTGGNGYWLLAAPESQAPSILIGGLEGRGLKPIIDQYVLNGANNDSSMWGIQIGVVLDVGAVAVDHRGLYLSTGNGATSIFP
jgi:hypothetical protein